MCSVPGGRGAIVVGGVEYKLSGMNLTVDLKVQVQKVATRSWCFCCKHDFRPGRITSLGSVALSVHVEKSEVTLAQRNQMTERS